MALTQQALTDNMFGHAQQLLMQYLPKSAQEDLRTFEWHYLTQLSRDQSLYTFLLRKHAHWRFHQMVRPWLYPTGSAE
jgi:hypothetical protein